MKTRTLKPLAITFISSGIWDTIAAFLYFFVIGSGRIIDQPAVHPFYTVFLGSFFICFAFIQFLSAANIRLYAFNVGCLIIGRLFYIIQLYAFLVFDPGFPTNFWFTGIIDGVFVLLYFIFAFRGGLCLHDLFFPKDKTIAGVIMQE